MASNKRFGELLSEGIVSIAKRRQKSIAAVEREIAGELGYTHHTVQRWRRGHLPKDPAQVAFIVRYCVSHGRVDRDWAQGLLTQAHHPDRKALLQDLFPERPGCIEASRVYQNLPPRYGDFLGREADMARVLEGLASRWPLISIEGLGGVGKTTLAIETAQRCLPRPDTALNPPFEAVVWVSAKDRPEQKPWLNEVLDGVARVLDYPYITQLPAEQKPAEVDQLLRAHRTLVIVDNFETIEDSDLVRWIQRVPEPSKVLITSRYAQLRSVWAIHLRGLEEPEALELIRRHVRRLGLWTLAAAPEENLLPLARVTEGNPKAIEMALGYVKYGGLSLGEVVDHLHAASQTVGDIFQDLFVRAWEILTEDARHVLLVMPFFVDSASKEALGVAAGLKGYRLDVALGQLMEMSLLDMNEELVKTRRHYSVHPLTRAFAKAQLRQTEFEGEACIRAANHYVLVAAQYGGWGNRAGFEWFETELANIFGVLEWAYRAKQWKVIVDLTTHLTYFWGTRGYWYERIHYGLYGAYAAEQRGDLKALAWFKAHTLGWVYLNQGHFEKAETCVREGMAIFEQIGERQDACESMRHLGKILRGKGDLDTAQQVIAEALEMAEAQRFASQIDGLYSDLGDLACIRGNYEEAQQFYESALQGFKIREEREREASRLIDLGNAAFKQGKVGEARSFYEAGLTLSQEIGRQDNIANATFGLAIVNEQEDSFGVALEHARQALDLFHRLGMRQEEAEAATLIERLERILVQEKN